MEVKLDQHIRVAIDFFHDDMTFRGNFVEMLYLRLVGQLSGSPDISK